MEGSQKEMTFSMHEELQGVVPETATFYDYNRGFLKKEIFEKEYEADYKKRGFMNPEDYNWFKPTSETAGDVNIYFPEPEKKAVEETSK